MPAARATGWRLRSGIYTVSALTTTYLVTSLAVQSDQNDSCPWILASNGTTTPTPARIANNADKSRGPDGFKSWQWRFSYMTNGMVNLWLATFLPGDVWSADVTALTYDEADQPEYYTALIYRPQFPSQDAQYAPGGWGNVIFKFDRGVEIFA
jgi:hypothetical protein